MGWLANDSPGGTRDLGDRDHVAAPRARVGATIAAMSNSPTARIRLTAGSSIPAPTTAAGSAEWQLWLRGSIAELPSEALPPVRQFQVAPTPNLTGTMEAFRPDGPLGSGTVRPASTGDYEPWVPE